MIGKWAVFLEQWPDIASQVIRGPKFMSILESTARNGSSELSALLSAKKLYSDESQLSEFLKSSPHYN